MANEMPTPHDPGDGPQLAGHTYDGIQEYDNPTPRWWDLLFVATIVFSPIYALWFHAPSEGRTLADQYEAGLAENMRLQFGEIGELAADEPTILQYMNEPEWLKVGASTFATNCVSCHGRQGEGISGPNLTDDHYLNVKQIVDIAKVVAGGAKNGAMPAWGNRLHPNEVVLVAAYVASLRGQNLPGPRPAEGAEIAPWPAAPPAAEPSPDKQATHIPLLPGGRG
jgi:cytochrome c oxidase cbb3-type subunit 3